MNTLNIHVRNRVIFLTIFSIAMGFLEAVVVIYLRQLYYPEGFAFPLKLAVLEEISLEYFREISTIIMLLCISIVAGKNFSERFSYFLLCFGVWDIFYYIWLKALINWPPSLLTWDILFLIPVVWAGPVLAPVICSVTMVAIAGCVMYFYQKGYPVKIHLVEWIVLSLGVFIIITSFVWEYSKIIIQGGFFSRFLTLGTDPHFQKIVTSHVPTSYNWLFFIIGESLILCFLAIFFKRMRLT